MSRPQFDRSKLAGKGYFQSVINAMKALGFEFLAWVTIDSTQHKYHVDWYLYTRTARLFFYVPGKSMVVMLACNEFSGTNSVPSGRAHFVEPIWDTKQYGMYWEAKVFFNHTYPSQSSYHNVYEWLVSVVNKNSQFCCTGGSVGCGPKTHNNIELNCETSSAVEHASVESITSIFGKLLELVVEHLYERFDDLNVWNFAPVTSYNNCGKAFWSKFPQKRLANLTDRVTGIVN